MKKALKKAFFLALLIPLLASGRSAYPSLLPSNPFYFTKEGVRNLRRALTFNPLNRVDLELRIVDERLSEILKLASIKNADLSSMEGALDGYRESLEYLDSHLGLIKDGGQTAKLLDELVELILTHNQFLDDLLVSLSDKIDLSAKVEEARTSSSLLLKNTLNKLQTSEEFRLRVKKMITSYKNSARELRTLEFLHNIDVFLKNDLLINLASRIGRGDLSFKVIENLPGDLILRLQLLDEAREKIFDVFSKSQIAFSRQQLLEKIVTLNLLDQERLENNFMNVQSASRINEQVKHLLSESKKALSDRNYVVALSQISLAQALVNNLAFEFSLTNQDLLREINLVKQEYNLFSGKSRNLFLEKQIQDLLNKPSFVGLVELKLILAEMRNSY